MVAPSYGVVGTKLTVTTPSAEGSAPPSHVSFAIFVALVITILGLHVVIQGALWWFQLCLLTAVLLGVAALVRKLVGEQKSRRWMPVIVALAVELVALTAVFVPTTAILALLPTPASFGAFGDLYAAALQSIDRQSVPAVIDTGLLFVLFLGVGLVAIAADALAGTLKAPALSGLPLLVLLAVPSAVSIQSTDPIIFVIAAFGYLLILRSASPHRQTRSSVILASVALVATLLVPLAVPPTGVAEVANSGTSTGINPILSLGSDLRQDIDHPVLRYTTSSGDATYLRLATIDNFTGSSWSPNLYRIDRTNQPEEIASPPGLAAAVARTKDKTTVTVSDLKSPWVPVPYPASAVTGLKGDWYWNADNQSIASPNITSQSQTYTAVHLRISPTPEQLSAAGATVPTGFSRYLQLPANMPKNIRATAENVAGQASTNYDKALLLQNYFRLSDFIYSETAPVDKGYDGTGMQVISKFLTAKSGYCIHFASAMAVMARTLGIPSRIDIGFLPGSRDGATRGGSVSYTVTSHDLHAWPELYFEGIGWTRFEPTVTRGDLPAYADPQVADVPVPINQPDVGVANSARPSAAPSAKPSVLPGAVKGAATVQHRAASPSFLAPLILLLVALMFLSPAVVRIRRRVKRLNAVRHGSAPVTLVWQEIRDTATDLGLPALDTLTPREFALELGAMPGLAHETDSIARLRAAVESHSFAATPFAATAGATARVVAALAPNVPAVHPETGSPSAADDASIVIAALRASTGRWQRIRAIIAPVTIWLPLRHWLGGAR